MILHRCKIIPRPGPSSNPGKGLCSPSHSYVVKASFDLISKLVVSLNKFFFNCMPICVVLGCVEFY